MLIDKEAALCSYEHCRKPDKITYPHNRIREDGRTFHYPECYLRFKGITQENIVRRKE